jgi:hypothetical protein
LVLEFKLRALARQVIFCLSPTPSHFCWRYFSNRVSHLWLGQPGPWSFCLCFPSGMTGMHQLIQLLLIEMRSFELFSQADLEPQFSWSLLPE